MTSNRIAPHLAGLIVMLAATTGVHAAPVLWVDWTGGTPGANGSAQGVLTVDGETVDVTYTGQIQFLQTGAPGETNYFIPSAPYVSATVDDAPGTSDIIALSTATSHTLTFSKAVKDLLFAVVSLNGNGYRFDSDFEILSMGQGYWGNGTLTKDTSTPGEYLLNGSGEPHGVVEFTANVTSITWTSLTNENWNGFTIGVRGLAAVPEPSSLVMAGVAAAAVAGATIRRRSK
ncbi:MAG: hypothetical protein BGO49_30610 [Planctomycetales bacterium 71-10]|nr:MAG: hypothetical protein BGO49_30610 [Planctomycetales bacterium 71-10]